MNQIEIHIHADGKADPRPVKIAEDATVEELVKAARDTGCLIGELEEEILLLIETEQALVRKEHRLLERGVKDGHHVHIGKPKHIFVAVVTTSGVWPQTGFDDVPLHQPIKVELLHAVKELKIKDDTKSWVAKVDGRELNIDKNYIENGLRCKVDIDYGPREGGGGNE
jgi:hypothetical protein